MHVTNSQVELLARMLDVASLRHNVIAQNVANVNTPGFLQLDVAFEEAFAAALAAGQDTSALRVQPTIVAGNGGLEREDGNNVDIDGEMGRLAKNSTLYKVFTQIMALQLSTMRSAISGR